MRLFVCLTAAGGTIVIAGLATGLAGEASRLTGGRGWHGIVLVAEMLFAVGLFCGTLLVVAVAWWQLSNRWWLTAERRPRTATGGHTGAAAAASAQQKMTQIKDLYREAEAMTDAELQCALGGTPPAPARADPPVLRAGRVRWRSLRPEPAACSQASPRPRRRACVRRRPPGWPRAASGRPRLSRGYVSGAPPARMTALGEPRRVGGSNSGRSPEGQQRAPER